VDISFGSTGDDNFEPWSKCDCVAQDFQEYWTAPVIATFVECINDKDESMLWVARKVVDEVKEERVLHRLGCQIWVGAKTVCDNAPKRGEDSGECVDESRKDILGIVQIRVVPPAEKGSSEEHSLMKAFTDRMSQRRFADPGRAVEPVGIAPWCVICLLRASHPGHDLIKDRLASAFHTAEIQVIAGFDRFEPPKQNLLLYTKPLSMNHR